MRRLGLSAVLLLVAGCSPFSVTAAECTLHWNEGGPYADVAAEGYAVAEVGAGENKAGQWGCGVLFHSDRGEPWRGYFVIVDEGGAGRWDSQSGEAWGTDSPDGAIETTVGVRSDGRLATS